MMARQGCCKFGEVLLIECKVLRGKRLRCLFAAKPSRTLQDKSFSILDNCFLFFYATIGLLSRNCTLKTEYSKIFKRGAFQLTINPMRDWNKQNRGEVLFTMPKILSINNKPYEGLKLVTPRTTLKKLGFQLTINPMRDWNVKLRPSKFLVPTFQLTINPMRDWNEKLKAIPKFREFFQLTINPMRDWNRAFELQQRKLDAVTFN